MKLLDFIADDSFRESVRNDYGEMEAAKTAGAWKCVVVMAGSIIEAILVDHLITTGTGGKSEGQLLKMELGAVIDTCRTANVLSKRIEQLSTVVKDYRNLIHAGRGKRLGETADEATAAIATSLLQLVVNEVSAKQMAAYGFTAEQVVAKIHNDPTAFRSIYASMLPKVHAVEKRKLLLKVLPALYAKLSDEFDILMKTPPTDKLDALKTWAARHYCVMEGYALTHAFADDKLKGEAAKAYLDVVHYGDEKSRRRHEHAFFRARHLRHTQDEEARSTIACHLFSLMNGKIDDTVLRCTEGVGEFVATGGVSEDVVRIRIEIAASMVVKSLPMHGETTREWAAEFFGDLSNDWRYLFIAKLSAHGQRLIANGSKDEGETIQKLCEMKNYFT